MFQEDDARVMEEVRQCTLPPDYVEFKKQKETTTRKSTT